MGLGQKRRRISEENTLREKKENFVDLREQEVGFKFGPIYLLCFPVSDILLPH